MVSNQVEDGQKLVAELARDQFNVTAAGWIKTAEKGQWLLYIASTAVDDKGLSLAYRELNRTIHRLPELWIDPFEVMLISPNHAIAKDLIDNYRPRSAPIPMHYRGLRLGNESIEEAYLYPPPRP